MFKKFFINCDQATAICDKNQYKEASLSEKIKLNIHFLQCKICGLYSKQNSLLSSFFKSYAAACKTHTKCLSVKDKEMLKKKLKEYKLG